MLTYMVRAPEFSSWRDIHDALNKGNCVKALLLTIPEIQSEASIYWLSRMFELGVCLPKNDEYALLIATQSWEYGMVHQDLRVGYFIETGVGIEPDFEAAKEVYRHAIQKYYKYQWPDDEKTDLSDYKFFTDGLNFAFSGNYGSPAFKKAFDEYIEEAKL